MSLRDPENEAELRALLTAARAYLEVEDELGLGGLRLSSAPHAQASGAGVAAAQAARSAALRPAQAAVVTPGVTTAAPTQAAAAGVPTAAAGVRLGLEERRARLQVLAEQAAVCTDCVLHEQRTHSVFARGNPEAELVFVGEGPGRDEDAQGLPFVGKAGQLLDRMIEAMGYERDAVYICNVVKCRPPDNRTPTPQEAVACSQYLVPQLQTIAPKMIVALGRCAAQALGAAEATGSWRGRFTEWQGLPLMATYHPAFLLRSPDQKRVVWEDLQKVMAHLGKTPKPRNQ